MVPTPDDGDDLIGVGGPDEGPGAVLGLGDEALDGSLEINEQRKGAALEPSPGKPGGEALDGIEPGGRFRRLMVHDAGMSIEPRPDLEVVLVAAVIVEDDLDDFAGWGFGLDRVAEADELPDAGEAACSRR